MLPPSLFGPLPSALTDDQPVVVEGVEDKVHDVGLVLEGWSGTGQATHLAQLGGETVQQGA